MCGMGVGLRCYMDERNDNVFPDQPRGIALGSQCSIFGLTVLYGLYAPLVPVKFSIQGYKTYKYIIDMLAASFIIKDMTYCLPGWRRIQHDWVLRRCVLANVGEPRVPFRRNLGCIVVVLYITTVQISA